MPELTREECIELDEEIERMWTEEWDPLDAEAGRLFEQYRTEALEVETLKAEREIAILARQHDVEVEKPELDGRNNEILDRLTELETEIPEAEVAIGTAEESVATEEAQFAEAEAALHAQLDLVEYWIGEYQIAQDNLDCLVPGTLPYDEWHVKLHEADENITAFEEPLPELEAAFEQAEDEMLEARDELEEAKDELEALEEEQTKLEEEYIDNLDRLEEIDERDFMSEIGSIDADILTAEIERDEKLEEYETKQDLADAKEEEIRELEAEYEQHCLIYEVDGEIPAEE